MRKFLLLLLMSGAALISQAQTIDNISPNYCMRYDRQHLFLQKDSGLNVVDYDLEWPETVNYSQVLPLKRFMSQQLFGFETTSLDSALIRLSDDYGKPVTLQFKTLPDDRRFCYINYVAHVLSYSPGRWIAYQLDATVEPQSLSVVKPRAVHRYIIYDLSNGEVLLPEDVVSSSVVNGMESQNFYNRLFAPLSDDDFSDIQRCEVDGLWIDGQDICFHMKVTTSDHTVAYDVKLPYNQYSDALKKRMRRLVERPVKTVEPVMSSTVPTWRGDTIYNRVATMPVFKNGEEGLRQYLSHISRPEVDLGKPVKVQMSYVVDRDGNVVDVCVLAPVSPEIDRHAASVVRNMPRFTPGQQDGHPVCVRMYAPINYKP